MNVVRRVIAVAGLLALAQGSTRADTPPPETVPNIAAALSDDDCRAVWNTAAGRSDLSVDGAKPYVDSFEAVDTNRDKKISNAEFKAGCKAGLVHKFRPEN